MILLKNENKIRKKRIIISIILCLILYTGCDLLGELGNKLEPELNAINPTDNVELEYIANFAPNENHTWTIMLYLDGANDLEEQGIIDFNEIESGLNLAVQDYPDLLNYLAVIVLFDRIEGGYNSLEDDWTDTRLYKVIPDDNDLDILSPEIFDSSGRFAKNDVERVERNMGDPDTLTDFINYCTENYAADHYSLILWNHGDGVGSLVSIRVKKRAEEIAKAIAYDAEEAFDALYLQELQTAIQGSKEFGPEENENKIDLIGFDACLMANVEIAYEFKDLALYMVSSMADESQEGWDYKDIFSSMISQSFGTKGSDLAGLIVKSYKDTNIYQSFQTMSASDLSKMDILKTSIDLFAVAIMKEDKKEDIEKIRDNTIHFFDIDNSFYASKIPYFDLNDFCYNIIKNYDYFSINLIQKAEGVISSLSEAILIAFGGKSYGNYFGPGSLVKRGFSIVFPLGDRINQFTGISYYKDASWYSSFPLTDGKSLRGEIDFCTFNNNKIVESWLELLEYWYDKDNILIDWNTY